MPPGFGEKMAHIRETLTLEDQFSQTMTRYIRLAEEGSASAGQMAKKNLALADSQKQAAQSAGFLTDQLQAMAGAYLGLRGVQALFDLSDTLAQTSARLDQINAKFGTTLDLNRMIYDSAKRSRGSYEETANLVAQLGTLAPEAFSGPEELIAFAEQINKQYALARTSAEGMRAANLQLTQALSSGTLRGEELNSILEQAPNLIGAIGTYLGKTTGEIREMASEGKITSEVVKAAVLSAAKETDAQFEKMPMTWAQVWTMMKNTALWSLRPVLAGISWLADHIQVIGPPLLALGAILGMIAISSLAFNAAQGVSNLLMAVGAAQAALHAGASLAEAAAVTTATGAQVGLNAALLACPITWIVGGILLLIGVLYAGVAAFNELTGSSVSATGLIAGAFASLGTFLYNTFLVPLWNGFANFANFVGNFLNDPVGAIGILFLEMTIDVLGYIAKLAQGLEDLVNKIPGVTVDLTSGVEAQLEAAKAAAQQAKDASGWKEYAQKWDYVDYSQVAGRAYDWGANLGGGSSDSPFDYEALLAGNGISSTLDGIASDVSSIKKETTLSNEDLRSLVDMAERRYVNTINLTSQSPVITVQGQNTGNTAADRQALANAIKDILVEQSASSSLRSTARIS